MKRKKTQENQATLSTSLVSNEENKLVPSVSEKEQKIAEDLLEEVKSDEIWKSSSSIPLSESGEIDDRNGQNNSGRAFRSMFDMLEEKIDSYKSENYMSKEMQGRVSFNYSHNDGDYQIGTGKFLFQTSWSKSDDNSIQAHKNGNIEHIGYYFGSRTFPIQSETLPYIFDYSSKHVRPNVGEVIVWLNHNGMVAETKIVSVIDNSRPSSMGKDDNLVFDYIIYDPKDYNIAFTTLK